ncbi:uncharacterized protein (DUF924 family) [Sphingomonas kyeonggiensis]|uniref:Uncharacterized protein (DUF924 family) n=1 Tax=Sphingomonas kyeonggiensis TaxID=1268553 RepID=A0A7W7K1T3_9SPHN|nr:DUF924 family protein [Sphingomonas kyeonggiensis]MBB4839393.1 uncharacterized protein (DUF924 family) [Sphingomonas kyeonggiensis]
MTGDLGAATLDVHAKAREVLGFWFALTPEQHFARSAKLDAEIKARFGPLRDLVLGSGAAGWRDDPETLLAAIVLLDQFSRNLHRDSAEAYAADPLALQLALEAIDRGWEVAMTAEERQFLYLPLEHAEDPMMQALSVEKFGSLGDAYILDFAEKHAEVIRRFGRFPSRNAALGRESTAEEVAFLSDEGSGW